MAAPSYRREEIAPRFNHLLAFQLPGSIISPDDRLNACLPRSISTYPERRGRRLHRPPGSRGCPLFHVKHYPGPTGPLPATRGSAFGTS